MGNEILYLKIEQNTEVQNKNIYLQDFAKLYCSDYDIQEELKQMLFWEITEDKDTKYMFSVMKVIEEIENKYPALQIVNLGETDFIITYKLRKDKNKAVEYAKAVFVAFTAFFGGAFLL